MDLQVEERRLKKNQTGIVVRAKYRDKWGAFDIGELTKDSLIEWLRSREGKNEWMEGTILHLLNHL